MDKQIEIDFSHSIPEKIISWVNSSIGNFVIEKAYRLGSNRTGVWRIRSPIGKYYLKIFQRRNRWGTEVFVYRNWISSIAPFAPIIIDVYDCKDYPGILLSEVSGIPLRETSFFGVSDDQVYFRAGQLLRRLQDFQVGDWFGCVSERGLPLDWSGNPLKEELLNDLPGQKRETLCNFLRQGEAFQCFYSDEKRLIQWAIGTVDCYKDEKPVPTSEDYTPGNWLVNERGELAAIIDFENMLWSDRMLPFTRLANDYFPNNPNGEKAFLMDMGNAR